jgi:hypothetical protein
VTLTVRGLGVGKWLHNIGAVGLWVPALLLIALAGISYARFGSATPFTVQSLVPSTPLKDIIFWSTIALIPAEDEANKVLAVTKVAGLTGVLLLGGAAVYFTGKRRRV